jgi:hypothetical protein
MHIDHTAYAATFKIGVTALAAGPYQSLESLTSSFQKKVSNLI